MRTDDLAARVEAYHQAKLDIAAVRAGVAEIEAERKQLYAATMQLREALTICKRLLDGEDGTPMLPAVKLGTLSVINHALDSTGGMVQ